MKSITLPNPPRGFPQVPSYLNDMVELYHQIATDKHLTARYIAAAQAAEDNRIVIMNSIAGFQRWIGTGMKVVFPDPHVFEACINTDALEFIKCRDLKTVYPEFLFYLPSDPPLFVDGDIRIIAVLACLMEDHEQVAELGGEKHTTTYPQKRWISFDSIWSDGTESSFIMGLENDTTMSDEIKHVAQIPLSDDVKFPSESREKAGKAVEVFVNMMLVMQSYPEYCQPFETKHRIGGKTSKTKSVHIVLPDPLRQKIRPHSHSGDTDLPGPSERGLVPVYKWRRGHWRKQPHRIEWEQENPEKAVIDIDEQRRGHLVWMIPVFQRYWERPAVKETVA
jgi:hypothetical protein